MLKKISKVIAIIVCLALIGLIYFGINLLNISNNEGSQNENDIVVEDNFSTNILLIGQDSRSEEQKERSDSMILVSVDKKNNNIKLVSFMRDMYLEIPGHGSNRINASYKFGGKDLLKETIEKNFDIKIDNTVEIDFYGFKDAINCIGGVEGDIKEEEFDLLNGYIADINVMSGEDMTLYHLSSPGLQTINGTQALAYARIRYVGNGDFERTERQRTILIAAVKKAKESNLLELIDLYKTLMPSIETDLGISSIVKLAKIGLSIDLENFETYNIPADAEFSSQRIDGMAVLVPNLEKCKEKLSELNIK